MQDLKMGFLASIIAITSSINGLFGDEIKPCVFIAEIVATLVLIFIMIKVSKVDDIICAYERNVKHVNSFFTIAAVFIFVLELIIKINDDMCVKLCSKVIIIVAIFGAIYLLISRDHKKEDREE